MEDNNTEKRWKRGDVGPDGRVFWQYYGSRESWKHPEDYNISRERASISQRRRKELNPLDAKERNRRYWQANRDILRKKNTEWHMKNKELQNKKSRDYYYSNRHKLVEKAKTTRSKDRENYNEAARKRRAVKLFSKIRPSSLDEFYSSLSHKSQQLRLIINLRPDPGQTLAELIHKLSGYSMEVCEQIANPPIPDEIANPPAPDPIKPAPEQQPEPPPVFNPDEIPF